MAPNRPDESKLRSRRLPQTRQLHEVARRYLRKGPPFLERYLPFWIAVTVERWALLLLPAVGILPYFFAGSLFPISTLPSWLGAIAKFIPLTHALALMRYAFVDPRAGGLHDLWGSGDPTRLAAQSLAVLLVFAIAMIGLSVRVFNRAAVK